jgi:hypothetical protein
MTSLAFAAGEGSVHLPMMLSTARVIVKTLEPIRPEFRVEPDVGVEVSG